MMRLADWHGRLTAAIHRRLKAPFVWGGFDCCMAAADLIKAETGTDVAKDLRTYSTARGAALVLYHRAPAGTPKNKRLEAVAEGIALAHGFADVPVLRAQRGDAVIITAPTPGGNADMMGIVDLSGQNVIVPALIGGWAYAPLAHARRAWRVG